VQLIERTVEKELLETYHNPFPYSFESLAKLLLKDLIRTTPLFIRKR
jgi:hypothetical protein